MGKQREEIFKIIDKRRSNEQLRIIISVPHAGRIIPEDVKQRLAISLEEAVTRYDAYTEKIALELADYAVVQIANTSKHVINLNRSPVIDKLDLGVVFDPVGKYHASGRLTATPTLEDRDNERLVQLFTHEHTPVWKYDPENNCYLTEKELISRIKKYHRPYHQNLQSLLESAANPVVLIDLHSMSRGQFDIVLGDCRGRSTGSIICQNQLLPFLSESNMLIGYAGPGKMDIHNRAHYPEAIRHSGGFITMKYGNPDRGIYAIQIELNRRTCHDYYDAVVDTLKKFIEFLSNNTKQGGFF